MALLIDETEIDMSLYLEEALPKLERLKNIEERCPHCGDMIRYPLIARKRDIESFKELLDIMNKYLGEMGVPGKILSEIMDGINSRLNIQ